MKFPHPSKLQPLDALSGIIPAQIDCPTCPAERGSL